LNGWAPTRSSGAAGDPEKVEEVAVLGVVELQGMHDPVDDALGDAGGVAALKPDVVLARYAGEHRGFFPTQPGDPSAIGAEDRESCLLWRDPGAATRQELMDLGAHVTADIRVPIARHAITIRT
jgi:hypothetical protein